MVTRVMATACRRHHLYSPKRLTTQARSVHVSDEPLVLPAQVEYQPGKFKPVLSCSHDELIDAAMQYMTKAHEYRQLAEGLSKLASGFHPSSGTNHPPRGAVRQPPLHRPGVRPTVGEASPSREIRQPDRESTSGQAHAGCPGAGVVRVAEPVADQLREPVFRKLVSGAGRRDSNPQPSDYKSAHADPPVFAVVRQASISKGKRAYGVRTGPR